MYCSEIAAIKDEKKRAKAYQQEVAVTEWFQDTLKNRIACKIRLSDEEALRLYQLVSHGCRQHTKTRLSAIIHNIPYIPNYGIYTRVMIEPNNVFYCAGQDYPSEIKTVRDLLLGRIS